MNGTKEPRDQKEDVTEIIPVTLGVVKKIIQGASKEG
jgi:hypothetical protein